MAAKKKIEVTEAANNVVEEFDEKGIVEEVKDDIALVDENEETKDISEIKEETPSETLAESAEKLLNTVAEAIKKNSEQPKPEPQKKPFKLGFWGYLGLAVVVKGAVEIARAIADSKRPRR